MTLAWLQARIRTIQTWERQIGASEVYDERVEDLYEAKDLLMKDFILTVANGSMTQADIRMAASTICEAFNIR